MIITVTIGPIYSERGGGEVNFIHSAFTATSRVQ